MTLFGRALRPSRRIDRDELRASVRSVSTAFTLCSLGVSPLAAAALEGSLEELGRP